MVPEGEMFRPALFKTQLGGKSLVQLLRCYKLFVWI